MHKVRLAEGPLTSDANGVFSSIPEGAPRHHYPDDRRPIPVEDGVLGCLPAESFNSWMIWTRSAPCIRIFFYSLEPQPASGVGAIFCINTSRRLWAKARSGKMRKPILGLAAAQAFVSTSIPSRLAIHGRGNPVRCSRTGMGPHARAGARAMPRFGGAAHRPGVHENQRLRPRHASGQRA